MSNVTTLPNIYIIGEAGSGKNFITDIFKELYPGYQVISISKPLYDLAKCLKIDDKEKFISILLDLKFSLSTSELIWGDIPRHVVEELRNPNIIKPRKAIQTLGDILRHYNIDSLINHAIDRASNGPTIVDDVRLIKEGEYLTKVGFTGIRLYAEKEIRIKRLQARDKIVDLNRLNHKTETEVDKIPYNFFIDNTIGIKEELVDKISNIVEGGNKDV